MNLFLDCEWNGYQGELISMALVPEESKVACFYEELIITTPYDPWVREHVVPKLHGRNTDRTNFTIALERFLMQFNSVHVIADWPEDIMWFCLSLVTGPGVRINTPPLTTEIIRVDTDSFMPHNALFDAIAIRDWYINKDKTN